MSFTNKTPNYNLPQWLGSDKPAWLTDMNGAFSEIDTAIKRASDSGSSAEATANNALSTAQSAQDTAYTALTTANEAKTYAGNATTIANNANTQAGTAISTANEALTNSETALAFGTWLRNDIAGADLEIIPALTRGIPQTFNRFTFIYNKALNLMEISGSLPLNEVSTLTTYVDAQVSGQTYRVWPLYKLPFTCTNSLLINTVGVFEINNQDSSNKIVTTRNASLAITTYNNSAWMGYVTSTNSTSVSFATEKIAALISTCTWLQVKSLGEITLDGWTPIV